MPDTTICTYEEFSAALPALHALMKVPFPAQQSYHIAKLTRLVAQEVNDLNAQRDRLVRELGEDVTPTAEEQAKGQMVYQRVLPRNMEMYRSRLKELEAVRIEIPWGRIPAGWLSQKELPPDIFFYLEPLMVGGLT